jgi:hypothetical protein
VKDLELNTSDSTGLPDSDGEGEFFGDSENVEPVCRILTLKEIVHGQLSKQLCLVFHGGSWLCRDKRKIDLVGREKCKTQNE